MKKQIQTIVSALILSISGHANAETQIGQLDVMVDVAVTCVFGVTTVDFGTYTGATLIANGNISVTCTDQTFYTIALDGGQNLSAGNTRQMADPTGLTTIPYELLVDIGGGDYQPVGDIGYGDTFIENPIGQIGVGANQDFDIQGAINGGLFVPSDEYTDTLIVTLIF